MPKTPTTPFYADLMHKEEKVVTLGYVEKPTLKEAQDYLEKKYKNYEILRLEQATRIKL